MSNLNCIEAHTLPKTELVYNSSGELIGIRVKRTTYTSYYHRTDRGVCVLNDTGLNPLALREQNVTLLDLGCGNGSLVNELNRAGVKAWGLDLYLNERQKKSALFFEGDAFQTPFKEKSFDLVFSSWSVFNYEPLFQFYSLFSELKRILKPGGMIFIQPLFNAERIDVLKIVSKKLRFSMALDTNKGWIYFIKS